MATTLSPDARAAAARRAWVPRQHGAWAMLILPLLVGVAASSPSPWQLLLAAAAVAGHLASTTAQAWSRARRSSVYVTPLATYGGAFALLSVPLVVAFPRLLLILLVAGPAAVIVVGGARPGTKRDLANSLAQVAQALVLVPAGAYVSGELDVPVTVAATAVAAGYLVGTVLTVRSVIRERTNQRFAAASVAFHVPLVAALPWPSPWPYTALAVALAMRAGGIPVLQRRLAGGPRPLRPVHLGLVEIVASVLVVWSRPSPSRAT